MRPTQLLLALTLCVSLCPRARAQGPGIQQIILPNLYESKNRTEEVNEQVTFYFYPLREEGVPLGGLKQLYPQLEAPDYLEITLPDQSQDTARLAMVGVVPGRRLTEESIIVWLVSNYETDRVSFWLDRDNDRNYRTNTEYVWITPGGKPYPVSIHSTAGYFPPQELVVSVPKSHRPGFEKYGRIGKIVNRASVGAHVTVGQGGISYGYNNLETGFPSSYGVEYTEKGVGFTLDYNFRYVRMGLNGSYLSSTYYTSVLNHQVGEPELRTDPRNGRMFLVDRIDKFVNQDQHARRRLQYGIGLAGRLHITPGIELQPTVGLGNIVYLPGNYVQRGIEADPSFRYGNTFYQEAGLRVEFVVGRARQLYIEGTVQRIDWRPEGFFESVEHNGLRIDNYYWRVATGYRLGL